MTQAKALHEWTATEIVTAISRGDTTCEAVARACLDRIAAREPEVHAWQYRDTDRVLERARALDRSGMRGPLIGVPIGVKDIIDTADMPTEYGSPIYRNNRPNGDAACVALSRKAGAVVMGKTVTTEFANVHPGKTRNPHDASRTPGGSSSGSAAAVAASMVPLALGTQTTGSTIRPASFCGVFGYRPTWGDLRSRGVMEVAGSFDTLGVLARSVDDVALYRDVLLGVDPVPVANVPPPRIGLCRTHVWSRIETATRTLLEDAAQRLSRAGATVSEVTLPADFAALEDAHRWICGFEMSRNLTWEIENHQSDISAALRAGRLQDGLACSYEHYVAMRNVVHHCRKLLLHVFDEHDILLTPAAAGVAPVGLENVVANPWIHVIWTTLHVPTISIPVFKGPDGLPIGAQLVAKHHEDRKLFSAARWVYQCLTRE